MNCTPQLDQYLRKFQKTETIFIYCHTSDSVTVHAKSFCPLTQSQVLAIASTVPKVTV